MRKSPSSDHLREDVSTLDPAQVVCIESSHPLRILFNCTEFDPAEVIRMESTQLHYSANTAVFPKKRNPAKKIDLSRGREHECIKPISCAHSENFSMALKMRLRLSL